MQYPMSYVPCPKYHVQHPTSHIPPSASRPTSHIPNTTFNIPCLMSHILCPTSHIPCPTSHVPHTTFSIPCPMSHVPHHTSHIPCPTFHVRVPHPKSHIPCPAPRVLHLTSHMPHSASRVLHPHSKYQVQHLTSYVQCPTSHIPSPISRIPPAPPQEQRKDGYNFGVLGTPLNAAEQSQHAGSRAVHPALAEGLQQGPFFSPFQRKWAFFLNPTKFLQRVNPPPWAQALFLPACTVQAGAQRTFCSFAVLFQLKRRPRIIPFSAG